MARPLHGTGARQSLESMLKSYLTLKPLDCSQFRSGVVVVCQRACARSDSQSHAHNPYVVMIAIRRALLFRPDRAVVKGNAVPVPAGDNLRRPALGRKVDDQISADRLRLQLPRRAAHLVRASLCARATREPAMSRGIAFYAPHARPQQRQKQAKIQMIDPEGAFTIIAFVPARVTLRLPSGHRGSV